jgi:hypothetical protein
MYLEDFLKGTKSNMQVRHKAEILNAVRAATKMINARTFIFYR